MKFHQFWSVVPRRVRIAACSIVVCAILVGLIAGFIEGTLDAPRYHLEENNPAISTFQRVTTHGHALQALESITGLGVGLLLGSLIAIWILCLGYVYADARRRAMPAVPWTLAAILVPNLLGFLLYFIMRRPIGLPCTNCGQSITPDQRFCSWCGCQQPPSRPDYSGMNPTAAV
jgi:hypothetical protein